MNSKLQMFKHKSGAMHILRPTFDRFQRSITLNLKSKWANIFKEEVHQVSSKLKIVRLRNKSLQLWKLAKGWCCQEGCRPEL